MTLRSPLIWNPVRQDFIEGNLNRWWFLLDLFLFLEVLQRILQISAYLQLVKFSHYKDVLIISRMIISIAVTICWKGSILNQRDIVKANYYVWTPLFDTNHKIIVTKISTIIKVLVFPIFSNSCRSFVFRFTGSMWRLLNWWTMDLDWDLALLEEKQLEW